MLIRGKQIEDSTISKDKLSFDISYVHVQSTLSTVWTVNHNLDKFNSVSVYDSNDDLIEGEIHIIDLNTIQVSFNVQLIGTVVVS